MNSSQITDDLDQLLNILSPVINRSIWRQEKQNDLLEIILDLGRVPEARYSNEVITLGEKLVTKKDLDVIINNLGRFGDDNRAGIEGTLHRISAIRNRHRDIIGLTCRVGRAIFGTVALIRDLIESRKSILLMGKPGIGKTTALREIARVMAEDLNLRVVIIDTSNEIAGDCDIPHPGIGRARRMQVERPEKQHQVMIEAVENHMPQVIVIDEIGTELEANAARTIAERGVQLIATAHGNNLENLIKNPTLSDLVGGIQSVTLGDDEARRRHTQKTVLERAAEPTFPIAVEIHSRKFWSVHKDVSTTVDLLLRGQKPIIQKRSLEEESNLKFKINDSGKKYNSNAGVDKISKNERLELSSQEKSNTNSENKNNIRSNQLKQINKRQKKTINFFNCGLSLQILNESIRWNNWPIKIVDNIQEADFLLSLRKSLSSKKDIRNKAQELKIPIYVIKSDTFHQIERAIKRLLNRYNCLIDNTVHHSEAHQNDTVAALEECRIALEKIVVPLGKPVELSPRSEQVIQIQSDLVKRYHLHSDIFKETTQQRLRIYPP